MKILSLNCNSLISQERRRELELLLDKHQPQLVCLSETKLKDRHKWVLKDYCIYRTNSKSERSGGTAILVHKTVSHYGPKATCNDRFSATSVTVGSGRNSFLLASLYFWKVTTMDLLSLFNSNERILANGDFNARHSSWNCRSENSNGKILFDFCENNNVCIDFPTSNTRGDSTLDLVLAKNIVTRNTDILLEYCSDHYPVVSFITNQYNQDSKMNGSKIFDFSSADWDSYRWFIHNKLSPLNEIPINSTKDLEERIADLSKIIVRGTNKFIPLVDPSKKRLPPEIIFLIKFRNFLRNRHKKFPSLFSSTLINRITKSIHNKMQLNARENFRKKLSEVKPDKSNLYKCIRYIRPSQPTTLHIDGPDGPIIDSVQIANLVADHYEEVFSDSKFKTNSEVTKCIADFFKTSDSTCFHDRAITTSTVEVASIIKNLKNKKAPGVDGITNRAIKNLPSAGITQIVKIVNSIFSFQYFPDQWKISKIIVLPKSGKPRLPEFTRPISLLSGLSKIAEKIIYSRLWNSVETIIPEIQFGFVSQRSSTYALMRLTNKLKSAKLRRKVSAAAFLDVQKAFDSVWHEGLISKFIKANVPSALTYLIQSYLTNRSFFISIDNSVESSTKKIAAGVPQGSVLGPLLYLIFTHDVPSPSTYDTNIQVFADDTVIYCSSYSASKCSERIQHYLNELSDYFEKWNITLNLTKTQLIYFYPTRRFSNKLKAATSVKIREKEIEPVKSAKYLGITIDGNLCFGFHITNLRQEAAIAFKHLYPVLAWKSGLDSNNKLLVYKLYIRPIIMYAAPAWFDLVSPSHLNKLQVIQNKAMRFVFNSWPRPPDYKQSPISSLHRKAKIEFINEHADRLLSNTLAKLLSSPNATLNEIANNH